VDIVVGFGELHGRTPVLERLQGSEAVPLRRVAHQDRLFAEIDLDAILARRPRVALVDELLDPVITVLPSLMRPARQPHWPPPVGGQRRSRPGGEPP
jgi:Osmosensitive K+ channel His kinase sensor domain